MTQEERDAFVEDTEKKFTERLERIANDPDEWRTWVEEVAQFGARYSIMNQFLLIEQCMTRGVQPRYFMPYGGKDGRTGWRGAKRQVRKGESGFLIWAPIKRRPTDEQAQAMEAQGRKVKRDPDGRPSIQIVGFRLSNTFELSQTDPAEGCEDVEFVVPTVEVLRRRKLPGGREAQLLEGDDPTGVYEDAIKLIEAEGYTFEIVDRGTGYIKGQSRKANGVTALGFDLGTPVRVVQVASDLSPAQRIKTTIHELAHIRCEHMDGTRIGEDLHKGRRETEAESVAHIVCLALGLDSSPYTDAYVLTWADGDFDMIKEAMSTVIRVAKQILADLTPEASEEEPGPVPEVRAEDLPTGTLKRLGISVGDTAVLALRNWVTGGVDVVTGVVERSQQSRHILILRLPDGTTREIGGHTSKVAGRKIHALEMQEAAA